MRPSTARLVPRCALRERGARLDFRRRRSLRDRRREISATRAPETTRAATGDGYHRSVRSVKRNLCQFLCSWRPEARDEGDHSSGRAAVSAVAGELFAAASRAGGVRGDASGRDSGGFELGPVDGGEVQAEAAFAGAAQEFPGELRGDVAADLVAAGADRRPEERTQGGGRLVELCKRGHSSRGGVSG